MTKLLCLSLMVSVLLFSGNLYAESVTGITPETEPAKKEVEMIPKIMQGTISARSANGIALVYDRDKETRSSSEMWFPFEPDMRLERFKNAADIGEGDLVNVYYEEAEDGSRRVLTMISLLKRYRPEPEGIDTDSGE